GGGGDRGLARTYVAVEQAIHGNQTLHVLERVPRRPSLRLCQREAQARLEGLTNLGSERNRRGRLRRDLGPHQGERSLELEELGKRHAPPGLPVFGVGGRLVTKADRVDDAEQAVAFANIRRQQVFQAIGEREYRLDPARDLARRQLVDEVVLGHETPDPFGLTLDVRVHLPV